MRRFVVMSGLPASGKTTLGQRLGAALDLPVLDKDDYLSALFAEHDDVGPELRSKLSRQADVHLERDARERDAALTISFWRRAELSATSGTPPDGLATPRTEGRRGGNRVCSRGRTGWEPANKKK